MKARVLTTLGLFGSLALGVAQTIPNPSFEANSFTNPPGYYSQSGNGGIVGWVASGNTGLNPASGSPFADNGAIPDGTNVAFIQSGANSSLRTVISNLTVGQTYKVNFRVNARSGNTPNLKVDIAGVNVINTTVTAVANAGSPGPYQYFAFDFTAADTNQTMTLRNDAAGDNTVLLDDFSIAVRTSGWSYAAWNDDASSGVSATNIYTHAFHFGSGGNATINGVTFTGVPGPNPSYGGYNSFYTSGLTAVFNNDSNNLTNGGSAVLAHDFVYGGPPPETITINGLVVGNSYLATFYSVGFDSSGARAATFSVGDDRLTVNQDHFGYHNGIRVSYYYTALSKSLTLTYVPLSGSTFHTYGFANYLVSQTGNCHPPPPPTFTVFLPKVGVPPDDEGQGWTRPPVWEHLPDATDDSITVPNGRPIYALIVGGFASNRYLDELMTYNFARHLMARGAYVHYAWWNNLLAPYMERPLHHPQSHPGVLDMETIGNLLTAEDASNKAAPGEDYQFVADARLFLSAIRQNNPSAIIIVVGHSMGGGSVVHLGAQTDVVLDILAPLDPVNNRNYPWMPPLTEIELRTYNWTRWRVTRDTFLGFRELDLHFLNCVPAGPWLKDYTEARANSSLFCKGVISYHDAPTLGFGPHVINLHQRWQNEWFFPFDYLQNYTFGHSPPPGGTTSQMPIPTTPEFCGFPPQPCLDPGGWPLLGDLNRPCCETGLGVGWPRDGHGEIVGYRGPLPNPVPLGVRVRTSPQCGSCPNTTWPSRSQFPDGTWSNGDGAARVALLQALESLPEATPWPNSPVNPYLCLVSPGLINLFDVMNKPPVANAGGDQIVECDASHTAQVTLNGSNSTDPDGDPLEYNWTWSSGAASGAVATVRLPVGTNCVSLTVRDPSGHIDSRTVTVTVTDTGVGYVTSLNDSGAGSLREALAIHSVAGFAPSLDGGTITLTSGQISLSNGVTIDASSLPHGLTISGNNSSRIFEVSAGAAVTLDALTISDGNAFSGGGILVDSGGTLSLNRCLISSNSASGVGGGIANSAGQVVISNSTLSGNAADYAGAIENYGTLTITASTFWGNVATNNGGAIDNDYGAMLRLNNSTLAGNSAGGAGGGIENYQATALINNSTLSTNSASLGGGINNQGTLALTNTIAAGNTAPSFPDINLDVSGSFTGANNFTNGNPLLAPLGNYGGPTPTMPPLAGSPALDAGTDSVTNVLATDQRGFPRKVGAHVDIGAVEYLASALVTTIADAGGGSLRDATVFATNGTTITFTNTLSGQTLVLTNGQITLSNNNVIIDASSLPAGITLSGNHSNRIFAVGGGATATVNSLTLINGYGYIGGAIIVNHGGTLTLNNSTLSGNSAGENGGGIENFGTLTLNNSTLSGNSAASDAGGIISSGTLTLKNSTVSANFAGAVGGIELAGSGLFWLTNTIVAGNFAGAAPTNLYGVFSGVNNLTDGDPHLAPLGNYGGPTQTMPPLAGSPAIDAGTDSVTNFLAADQRGFPRTIGAHVDIGAVEYMASALVTTIADVGGGSLRDAVTFSANGVTITFTNTLSGQTIVLTNGQLTLNNNVIIDASSLPAGLTLSGNHSNRVFEVSAGATVGLNALTLIDGYADGGGAIRVDYGGTLTLNNSTLSGNSASVFGGGIGNFAGLVVITNSILSGNTAPGAGAIENDSGTVTISASTLSGNISTGNGGAIDNDNGALLRLDDSTLAGNSAVTGGGIENYQATALINDSTLSANSASYAGGINNNGTLGLTNTIVAGNTAPSQPDLNLDSSGSFTGANNLTNGNPLLSPLGNYGGPTPTMPPLAGSPAIDAGTDSVTNSLATDQRGFPRQIGGHVDIGAVEYMASPLVTTTADAGGGSLRDAVAFSTNAVTITFTNTLSGQTIVLTGGQLTLNQNVTIDASSLPGGVALSGNYSNRIFEVSAGATVGMNALTLINGNALSGGAILVDSGGTLSVNRCQVSGNSATYAGGIANYGTLTLSSSLVARNSATANTGGVENDGGNLTIIGSLISSNSAVTGGGVGSWFTNALTIISSSTLLGNIATNTGGAILNTLGAPMLLINSTLSGNSTGGGGGGLENSPQAIAIAINSTLFANSAQGGGGINNLGTLVLTNTIVAGNVAPFQPDLNLDSSGAFTGANNLTNGNPLLAPLGDYGGPTQTMPPLLGSPAIDAGLDSVTSFLATDQRGFPRRSGTHVDIGATEAQRAFEGNSPFLTAPVQNSDGTFGFNFANASLADFTVLTSTNVALPLGQWSILGAPMQSAPGQYQFTDLDATNHPQRFYQLVSP